jgi:hypothetical protein
VKAALSRIQRNRCCRRSNIQKAGVRAGSRFLETRDAKTSVDRTPGRSEDISPRYLLISIGLAMLMSSATNPTMTRTNATSASDMPSSLRGLPPSQP